MKKLGREYFQTDNLNESRHQDSNDNGVRRVNFATLKESGCNSPMFPYRTFMITPGPLLLGRMTTGLITYC